MIKNKQLFISKVGTSGTAGRCIYYHSRRALCSGQRSAGWIFCVIQIIGYSLYMICVFEDRCWCNPRNRHCVYDMCMIYVWYLKKYDNDDNDSKHVNVHNDNKDKSIDDNNGCNNDLTL